MKETFAGTALILALGIAAALAVAIARTWTPTHTSVLLGGGIAVAAIVAIGLALGARAYGSTHGLGSGDGSIIDVRPQVFDSRGERMLLDNEIRRERLLTMRDARAPRRMPELPVVDNWMEEIEG